MLKTYGKPSVRFPKEVRPLAGGLDDFAVVVRLPEQMRPGFADSTELDEVIDSGRRDRVVTGGQLLDPAVLAQVPRVEVDRGLRAVEQPFDLDDADAGRIRIVAARDVQ